MRDKLAICQISLNARKMLIRRIDAGEWKNSYHLPQRPNAEIDWNNIETINKITSILLQQKKDHEDALRLVETCLDISIKAGNDMQKQIKENNEPEL